MRSRPTRKTDVRPEGRLGQRAAARRMGASLVLSAVIHAGLLAWVVIEVPAESGPIARAPLPLPLPTLARENAERPIQVVQIRPPGVALPSGGAASRTASAPRAVPARPAAAGPRVAASTTAPGAMLAALSPVEARSTWSLPTPPGEPEETAAETGRPNRGVILRGRAGGGDAPSTGRGTGSSAGGSGRGVGVTTAGPGGDCITPGLALPSPSLGTPGARPVPRVRPGALAGGGVSRGGSGIGGGKPSGRKPSRRP